MALVVRKIKCDSNVGPSYPIASIYYHVPQPTTHLEQQPPEFPRELVAAAATVRFAALADESLPPTIATLGPHCRLLTHGGDSLGLLPESPLVLVSVCMGVEGGGPFFVKVDFRDTGGAYTATGNIPK